MALQTVFRAIFAEIIKYFSCKEREKDEFSAVVVKYGLGVGYSWLQ